MQLRCESCGIPIERKSIRTKIPKYCARCRAAVQKPYKKSKEK